MLYSSTEVSTDAPSQDKTPLMIDTIMSHHFCTQVDKFVDFVCDLPREEKGCCDFNCDLIWFN